MFWNSAKIIETLATVKANTENHNGELKEFKETFDKHIQKEDRETEETNKKIDAIHCKLLNFICPHDERIEKLEERYFTNQKAKAKRLIAEAEQRAEEIKERAEIDKGFVKEISGLQSRSKYNLLCLGALWTTLGIILKKIFTS